MTRITLLALSIIIQTTIIFLTIYFIDKYSTFTPIMDTLISWVAFNMVVIGFIFIIEVIYNHKIILTLGDKLDR